MASDEKNVVRIEIRRVTRRVPGLGETVFRAPAAAGEVRLAPYYAADEPNLRAFVNDLVAAAIESPAVDAAQIETLSERARASCRVAVAEVTGCAGDYRRLAGSGLSGAERLHNVMRARYEQQLEKLRRITGAMTDNVVPMAERTRNALIDSDAADYLARNQRQLERMAEMYTRAFRPEYFERLDRMSRQFDKLVTPRLVEQLTSTNSALNSFPRAYAKLADNLAHQLDAAVRPSYFGALEKLSEQINQSIRPRYLDNLTRLAERIDNAIRPQYLEQLTRTIERIQKIAVPRYVEQIARIADQLTQAPAIGRMREQLLGSFERYAAWIERNWATVYAGKNPHPILFLLAALPMAIGLPLLRALKTSDEPLLQALEDALHETALVDALQQAVQASPELDDVAKRYLVTGLEAVRDQRYLDAAPPLAWGLERAFTELALRRAIIDRSGRFLVVTQSKKTRKKKVEDLFEPLGLDMLYLRFLHAWVFGGFGNQARHGALPAAETPPVGSARYRRPRRVVPVLR